VNIRAALIALVVLALVPEAFAGAQQTQQSQRSTRTTITTTNGPSLRNGQHHRRFRHHRQPWWTPTVIIDSSMVQQMLNSPTPRPPSGKNTIDKPGGEVFKSIGN
jgi:hypothetical protein